ncbi:hypothetical protein SDC9_202682 [bioreactor metagenome]|uniref:Uncharacterized protein n=1 Tax=bioreactor metagenome TaxID=1076179 RepID=A0A645J6A3_9ZZZZ
MDELLRRHVAHKIAADHLAVAKHGDFVADFKDFFHFMGDIDDGNALFAEIPNHAEELRYLDAGQRGGWLVHDDDGSVL